MEILRVNEILKAIGGKLVNKVDISVKKGKIFGISTDTRTIKKGDLFIALKGKNFDGHEFIKDAFEKGACGAVISKKMGTGSLKNRDTSYFFPYESANASFLKKYGKCPYFLIKVKDTLRSLQDLASYYRSKFNTTVIGITGSNGKTTAKELVYCCISKKYEMLKNEGNFNNEIGVPLTLFNINSGHKFIVLELATNNFGEIKRLTEISKPKIGVVLNVGLTHTEFLKDIKGVSSAKQELVEALPEDGFAVLNYDDKNVIAMKNKARCRRCLTFGINEQAEIRATNMEDLKDIGMKFDLNINNSSTKICIKLIGKHNIYNALAAAACSYIAGLNIDEIKNGLESFIPGLPGRWNVIIKNNIRIIDDSYNANPESMVAAIRTFLNLNNTVHVSTSHKKILVLGDMLELGSDARDLHRSIGNMIAGIRIKGEVFLFTFGSLASEIGLGAEDKGFEQNNIISLNDKNELVDCINKIIRPGDSILIKGSRGMKMEEIVRSI